MAPDSASAEATRTAPLRLQFTFTAGIDPLPGDAEGDVGRRASIGGARRPRKR